MAVASDERRIEYEERKRPERCCAAVVYTAWYAMLGWRARKLDNNPK